MGWAHSKNLGGIGGASPWSEAERHAFAPPVKLSPTQWAEANRTLPPQMAAEPGPYRASRTPYLKAIQDAVIDCTIEEIVCIKAAQIGWSEAVRNILGFWIDNDPGPCLLVLPSESSARELVDERIRRLIDYTPAVKRHLSTKLSDNTKSGIKFDTMALHVAWAGSPQTLASRPCRYVLFEEPDKYPAFSGREADPISLGRERTKTYQHRRKILIGGTPTTREGHVWRAYDACGDRREYQCPCPHCGEHQQLAWTQIKWPKPDDLKDKVKLADYVEQNRAAWYECELCKARIEEKHKAKMIAGGMWISQGQSIDLLGQVSGDKPKSKRVGFKVTAMLSPWCSWSLIAAEGLRSMDDQPKWMNFRNSWLAEVFEEREGGLKVNEIRQRATSAPKPGLIPEWAGLTIASADTQKDRFYYTIRSWGFGKRSQLIYADVAQTFDELYQRCFAPIPCEQGGVVTPAMLVIDSGGHRTQEVYEFARRDPQRLVPIKGANGRQSAPIKISNNTWKDYGIALRYIDTSFFKDQLQSLMFDPLRWLVHSEVTDEYCNHQASEHKVRIAKKNKVEFLWQSVSSGAADHFRDCEVYNIVGAQIGGVDLIPPVEHLREIRRQERQALEELNLKPRNRYLGNTSNWLGGK